MAAIFAEAEVPGRMPLVGMMLPPDGYASRPGGGWGRFPVTIGPAWNEGPWSVLGQTG